MVMLVSSGPMDPLRNRRLGRIAVRRSGPRSGPRVDSSGRRLAPRTLVAGGVCLVVSAVLAKVAAEHLQRLGQVALVILAGSSVAVADSLIKKAAHQDDFWLAMRSPAILLAVGLYLVQIVLFTYVFARRWSLGVVGLMQMVVYAAVVVFVGIAFFQEKVSRAQGAGMVFALLGAVLMSR
jgi:drug/metabolite transporter (DMT)-like permease